MTRSFIASFRILGHVFYSWNIVGFIWFHSTWQYVGVHKKYMLLFIDSHGQLLEWNCEILMWSSSRMKAKAGPPSRAFSAIPVRLRPETMAHKTWRRNGGEALNESCFIMQMIARNGKLTAPRLLLFISSSLCRYLKWIIPADGNWQPETVRDNNKLRAQWSKWRSEWKKCARKSRRLLGSEIFLRPAREAVISEGA